MVMKNNTQKSHGWSRRLWVLLLLLLAVAAAETGCGAGSSAAPSGGGDTPVAVEIPALGEVSGLPFVSGEVVVASSDLSAPTKSMSTYGAKDVGVTGNPYTAGTSGVSCETTNSFRLLIDASTQGDRNQCMVQDMATQLAAAGINLYDGSYHVLATSSSFPGIPNRFKVKVTRNSSNIITGFELFTCSNTTQIGYDLHTISGSSATITAKNIMSTSQSALDVTGVLNTADPTQFISKSIDYTYTGSNDSGAYSGDGTTNQHAATVIVDTFDTRNSNTRVYSSVDLTNPSTTPFDPREYELGSGAGILSNTGGTFRECWNGTSLLPIECLSNNSNFVATDDQTTRAIATVTTPTFSTAQQWSCSGTAELTMTMNESDITNSDSCFSRFTINATHIDCNTSTAGAYYVQGALSGNGGASLSTSQSSPTSVTTSPNITLASSLDSDKSTFNASTVTLTDVASGSSVSLAFDNWSGSDHFTISPSLTSGHEYKLTVVGGSSGVKSGMGLTMATTQVYYITAQ